MDAKYLEIAFLLLLAGSGIYLASGGRFFSSEDANPGWIEMEKPPGEKRDSRPEPEKAVAAVPAPVEPNKLAAAVAPAAPEPGARSAGVEPAVRNRSVESRAVIPEVQKSSVKSTGVKPAVQAPPSRPAETLLEKAARLRSEKEVEKAVKIYRDILKKDKKSAKAYFGLGEIYMERGDYPQATAMFNSAAAIINENKSPDVPGR